VNSFLNLRVAGIWTCYKQWGDKGATFLTEPLKIPDGWKWRCYMRDPTGTSSRLDNTPKSCSIISKKGSEGVRHQASKRYWINLPWELYPKEYA
jgi:hypothetical protein